MILCVDSLPEMLAFNHEIVCMLMIVILLVVLFVKGPLVLNKRWLYTITFVFFFFVIGHIVLKDAFVFLQFYVKYIFITNIEPRAHFRC